MNFFSLRTIAALAATVLLTACGGQQDSQAVQTQTAAITVSAAPAAAAAAPSTGAPVAPSLAANMPAPDCAAEGCGSLRIIDGNAEAFRLDIQRRDAMQASLPQS